MVLLKNEDDTLPLSASASSIAVVGPFGDSSDLLGTWVLPAAQEKFPSVKVLDAVRKAAPGAKVRYARGVDAEGKDVSGIPEAVAAAKAADVTVVVVGEPPAISGEAAARSDISLPGAQEKLIAAVAETGKPFVVVLVNGRPLTIGGWLEQAPAVLEAWHPGIEAGNAIADVLFGAVNPGGKLPATFPRSAGQIPVYYNHENTGRPYDPDNKYTSKYLDLPDGPQFAFGFGLSYTTFEVGEPRLSSSRIAAEALRKGDTVEVAVPVTNTGERAGDEVVQLYVHDRAASIAQPVRRLRGFRRVGLAAGKSRTVRFRLGAEDFGFWSNDRGRRIPHRARGDRCVRRQQLPGQGQSHADDRLERVLTAPEDLRSRRVGGRMQASVPDPPPSPTPRTPRRPRPAHPVRATAYAGRQPQLSRSTTCTGSWRCAGARRPWLT